MTLRDEILALRDKYAPKPVPVEVDGKTVFVHAMSMADRLDFDARKDGDRLVLVVMRTARDAEGRRLFTDADADLVRGMPDEFSLPVWQAAIEVSGLKADEAEEVEESAAGKANGSPTSPALSTA